MRSIIKFIIVHILTLEAAFVLKKRKPFIVGITGSVGKTTAKEAIAHVLSERFTVRKSQKSFNSEFGVPLTVLGLDNAWDDPMGWLKNMYLGFKEMFSDEKYPEVLVLEIGVDRPGDMRRLLRWIVPDIAVITSLPERPVHVENFPEPEAVRNEKSLLALALRSGGVFVGNGDDRHVRALSTQVEVRPVLYGYGKNVDFRGGGIVIRYATRGGTPIPVGMDMEITHRLDTRSLHFDGVLGQGIAFASLAAVAVGVAKGMRYFECVESVATMETPQGRMRLIEGKKVGTAIIDDSYNSSPVAAEAALELLKSLDGKRKIAILGDMLELGQYSEEEHWRIGRLAGSFVDELLTVGKRARWIAEAAKTSGLPEGRIHTFSDSTVAGMWMMDNVKEGDIVLVKGSQGSGENKIRMERAVKELMAHPEDAAKLLVRQGKEWEKR
jgi:UDP-N-acetylmuramoyl-tripeptide--D-alanyl-D-alanine ligase